ncbi:MAG TPA: family 78 glycoside hydrolase catalytic domain, partial [Verrucomicrobiota bacterium]|nr:family 78 glycoside hydrolase catalytic domain [Verrucomicrobiota bacterium]
MKHIRSLHGTRPLTRLFAAIAALGVLSAPSLSSATFAVGGLRCEYRVNPVGLDVASPRLSWTLASDERGQKQTAYRVLAASTPDMLSRDEGNLWDSGRVDSDRTVHVAYEGKPLRSRMRVWWKVQVWDRAGRPCGWSPASTWTMGLLEKADWQARWIADPVSLTNILLNGPRNGYHSQLATNASTTKWIALDLRQPVEFDAIALFPARPYDWQPDTPGFLFPLRWRLEAAQKADFSDARLLVDRTGLDEPNPGASPAIVRFPATTARHVRLTATRLRERDAGQHGLALAEFEVLRGQDNLAARASVTALDSIETGAWAKANLTDGATVTLKPGDAPGALPATLVRKSFQLDGVVKRATAYATACGLYELRLNGRRVGDQLLMPEWTSYRKRIQYQVFDVTDLLQPGTNALAAALAEGWYAGRLMAVGRNAYGSYPRFLLQLEIDLADGRTQRIVTDESWRSTTDGPIRSAGIYDGEVYDARKESDGWDESGFNDSDWRPARVFGLGDVQLVWQRNEPIRVVRELHPIAQTEPRPGVHVFDLGQNMVGWCRIAVRGSAGQGITIRHAEMLNDDGTLYTANLRGAPQIDRYIPRADGDVIYEPRFTYHGFR